METIKKRIIWVPIIITILYSMVIHYLDSKEIQLSFGIGYSFSLLIIPFALSLIVGLYFLIRKTFSWTKVQNSFAIFWVLMMLFAILFIPPHGLFSKENVTDKLKELVRQHALEMNAQRRLYNKKTQTINVANISKPEDVKNIELLLRAKSNITQQKEIEDWNYSNCVSIEKKWKTKFESFLKENSNEKAAKIIEDQESNFNDFTNSSIEKKRIQNDYFLKYNSLLDYYISENNNISIKNNTLMFKDDITMNKYNSLQKEYDKALQLYLNSESNWKIRTTNNLDSLNKKYFNFKEYDTLINMVRYDKY